MGFGAPRNRQSRDIQLFVRGCALQEAKDKADMDDVLDAIIDSPKFRRDLAQADAPIVDIGQGDQRRTMTGREKFDWRKCIVWGVGIVFVMCVYGAAMRGLFAWWGGA